MDSSAEESSLARSSPGETVLACRAAVDSPVEESSLARSSLGESVLACRLDVDNALEVPCAEKGSRKEAFHRRYHSIQHS